MYTKTYSAETLNGSNLFYLYIHVPDEIILLTTYRINQECYGDS